MASTFKKGDAVTQVLPAPIQGVVTGFALCQETGDVHAQVTYTDADGAVHVRHFAQSELKATPAPVEG